MHPTLAPPFNTAIVRGYNALTGAKVKLGRSDEYLAMRRGMLELNAAHRGWLSNDLGAIAGFLFDVGCGRVPLPPVTDDAAARAAWEADLAQVRIDAGDLRPGLGAGRQRRHGQLLFLVAPDRRESRRCGRCAPICMAAGPTATAAESRAYGDAPGGQTGPTAGKRRIG